MAITCNPSTFRSISPLFLPVWSFVLDCVWESEDSYTAFLLWSSETLCIYCWTCCNCYFTYTHTKAHTIAQTQLHTQRQKRRETTMACKRVVIIPNYGYPGVNEAVKQNKHVWFLWAQKIWWVCVTAAFVGVLPLLSMLSSLVSY